LNAQRVFQGKKRVKMKKKSLTNDNLYCHRHLSKTKTPQQFQRDGEMIIFQPPGGTTIVVEGLRAPPTLCCAH